MNPDSSSGIYLTSTKETYFRVVVENCRKHDDKKKASEVKSGCASTEACKIFSAMSWQRTEFSKYKLSKSYS